MGFLKKPASTKSEVGFLKKPASTKSEVGFLSGFSKVGFVENYGLSPFLESIIFSKQDIICLL